MKMTDARAERQADQIADAAVRGSTLRSALDLGAVPSHGRGDQDISRFAAPPLVEATLRRSGEPLDREAHGMFGPDIDLSRVRVHTDPLAADSARSIGAYAYTFGDHVVFDRGQFAPHTTHGRKLLAHELGHVVQQRGSGPQLARQARPEAQFVDDRLPVLPAQEPLFAALVADLVDVRARIQALLAAPPADAPTWARLDNPNVASVMTRLDQLVGELQGGRLILRFGQPSNPDTVALYSRSNNVITMRPFDRGDRAASAVTLVALLHEYQHARDDREDEAKIAQATRRREHSEADELTSEIRGFEPESYFAGLLEAIGRTVGVDGPRTVKANANMIRGQLEVGRLGSPETRRDVPVHLRRFIGSNYGKQIRDNSPASTYVVRIEAGEVARLYPDDGRAPIALGAVPANVRTRDALRDFLAPLVLGWSGFDRLFDRGSFRLTIANFAVVHQGRVVAEFSLAPPTAQPGGRR